MRSRHLLAPVLFTSALGLLTGCGSSTGPSAAAQPPAPQSAAPAATSAASSGPSTVQLVEKPTNPTFTPKGGATSHGGPTKQPTAGDVIAFDGDLTRAGAPAGHDHVSFTYQANGSALVSAVLTLTDGTIVARGTAPVLESVTVPVESGTGAYAARTGSLTAKHVNEQEDDLAVALR